MDILQATHLKKYYGSGENLVKAVDDLSFTLKKGEFAALVGTSGSGKTTLLNLVGGLDYADSGEVVVDGQSLFRLKDEELTVFRRRKIGFIFRNYNLVATMNIYKNAVLPVRLDGNRPDSAFVDKVFHMLGIADKKNSMPGELSCGQQQRAAIARAVISKPALILSDEPTGNLDSRTSAEVMGFLQETSRQFDQTVLMITHNEDIAQMADRILHIEDGRLAGDSSSESEVASHVSE